MRALVTGGNGFIGSHLVDRLLTAGDSVRVIDISTERFRDALPDVAYVIGKFSDAFLLAESLTDIDIVYHLASSTVPSTSNLNPVEDVQDNLVGTVRLLEQMLRAGVVRIVFLSSGGTVYGNPEHIPVAEDHPLHPICSYGVVKAAIERYLYMYQQLYGLSPVVLRPSNVYGPRQLHVGVQGVITTFLNSLVKKEKFTIWGDGNVVRDYLYVDDLTELMVVVGHSSVTGVFNAASGQGHSLNDIIDIIVEVTRLNPDVEYKEGRDFDVKELILDTKKAEDTFGWTAGSPLASGIEKQWRWMRGTG
jgi:UDP-glucose 4-epimerase